MRARPLPAICLGLLLQLWLCGGQLSEAVVEQCVSTSNFVSPYVTPYLEQYARSTGCESRENRTVGPEALTQEVHVFSQEGDNGNDEIQHIHVNLLPRQATGEHDGPVVMVLASPRPIVWHLQTTRMANDTRLIVVLDKRSRLKVAPQDQAPKIRKKELPMPARDLLAWVRSRYRVVTSFTQVQHAIKFTRKVGINPAAPLHCTLTENFRSEQSVVVFLQQQPARGCAVSSNENSHYGSDVHIIELRGSSSNPHPEVVLQITAVSRAAKQRHLLVVLKGDHKVKWRIELGGMRGVLNIITGDEAETRDESDMQAVRLAAEQLDDYVGERLKRWVREKYGPIVSYTDVPLASHIELKVDRERIHRTEVRLPNSGFPENRPRGTTSPFATPDKTRVAINQAKEVTCTAREIRVFLRKPLLQFHGVRREHLSLLDPTCVAVDNSTHFILNTQLRHCGTKQIPSDKSVTFENAIVLRRTDVEQPLTNQDIDIGSADGNPDTPSMLSADHTLIDDEDYNTAASGDIRVIVQCRYPTGTGPQLPTDIQPEEIPWAAPQSGIEYHLDMYRDAVYQYRMNPVLTHDVREEDMVYMSAKVTGDSRLRVVVQNCWISPSADKNPEVRHPLIDSGCITERKTVSLDDHDNEQRFSFKYFKFFEEGTLMAYVGCQLTICSKDGNYPHVKKCVAQDRYCVTQHVETDTNDHRIIRHSETIVVGPLKLLEKTPRSGSFASTTLDPQDPNRSRHDRNNQRGDQPCQQIVRVEGLDSGTVVGIAFAAFIIGVLLTAALWFIHTHTGPIRTANRPRSTETSGESTPSSTAPITIHHT